MNINMTKNTESDGYTLVLTSGDMFIEMTLSYDGEDQMKFLGKMCSDIEEGKINERPQEKKET